MSIKISLSDKDAERLYHLMRNELDSGDFSEEDCDWYEKILKKLNGKGKGK